MFGDAPIELGLGEAVTPALARLAADPMYQRMFADGVPGQKQSETFVIQNVVNAIALVRADADRRQLRLRSLRSGRHDGR